MPRPLSQDPKFAQMYDDYKSGLSLADVAKKFGVTRQMVHKAFKARGWAMRTPAKNEDYQDFNGSRYTINNCGYLRKTDGSRELMHRDVWEYHNGPIPKGWDVHHRDENKKNNAIENLECLPKSEHTRIYSPHNNQFTRGRKRGHHVAVT